MPKFRLSTWAIVIWIAVLVAGAVFLRDVMTRALPNDPVGADAWFWFSGLIFGAMWLAGLVVLGVIWLATREKREDDRGRGGRPPD